MNRIFFQFFALSSKSNVNQEINSRVKNNESVWQVINGCQPVWPDGWFWLLLTICIPSKFMEPFINSWDEFPNMTKHKKPDNAQRNSGKPKSNFENWIGFQQSGQIHYLYLFSVQRSSWSELVRIIDCCRLKPSNLDSSSFRILVGLRPFNIENLFASDSHSVSLGQQKSSVSRFRFVCEYWADSVLVKTIIGRWSSAFLSKNSFTLWRDWVLRSW